MLGFLDFSPSPIIRLDMPIVRSMIDAGIHQKDCGRIILVVLIKPVPIPTSAVKQLTDRQASGAEEVIRAGTNSSVKLDRVGAETVGGNDQHARVPPGVDAFAETGLAGSQRD